MNSIIKYLRENKQTLTKYALALLTFNLLRKSIKFYKKMTPSNCVLELDLHDGEILNYQFKSIFGKQKEGKTYFLDLLETLYLAQSDKQIKGMVIRMPQNVLFGLSQYDELRCSLQQLRNKGKKIYCYFDSFGDDISSLVNYYLASACDKIYINKLTSINLIGLKVEKSFYKQMLEKLEIKLDSFKRTNYKNALNTFTEEKFDEYHKESVQSQKDTIINHIKQEIKKSRNFDENQIKDLFENSPFLAQDALEKQIIDGIYYADEVYEVIEKEFKDQKIKKLNFLFLQRFSELKDKPFRNGKKNKKVALINCVGNIMTGQSETPNEFSSNLTIGSDTVTSQVRNAYNDKNVVGIILRIDSGGGDALASDQMAHEILNAKKKGKKVIALMSNLAASGGYYMACHADKIICSPLTITGSIGVLFALFNLRDFWKKFGISYDSLENENKYTNIFSSIESCQEHDKILLNKFIDHLYDIFKQNVEQGRNMSREEVESLAQGRVWMGLKAFDNKLVDQCNGGYLESLNQMALITNSKLEQLQLWTIPEQKSLLDKLMQKPAKNRQEADKQMNSNNLIQLSQLTNQIQYVSEIVNKVKTFQSMIQNPNKTSQYNLIVDQQNIPFKI